MGSESPSKGQTKQEKEENSPKKEEEQKQIQRSFSFYEPINSSNKSNNNNSKNDSNQNNDNQNNFFNNNHKNNGKASNNYIESRKMSFNNNLNNDNNNYRIESNIGTKNLIGGNVIKKKDKINDKCDLNSDICVKYSNKNKVSYRRRRDALEKHNTFNNINLKNL